MDADLPSSGLPESRGGPEAATIGNAERAAAGRREAPPADALPCLYCDNSTGGGSPGDINRLTGAHKKSAEVLRLEARALAEAVGLERLAFLTLTFADAVASRKVAEKRFNSLATHVIRRRYGRSIVVTERQKSGRLHYHLLVEVPVDIRTRFDFAAVKRRDYRSACPWLRAEWKFWRKTGPRYGFGRCEMMPIRSNKEGISRYLAKYIAKHIHGRAEEDKAARLVRYLNFKPGCRVASTRFSRVNDYSFVWRHKVAAFAGRLEIASVEELSEKLGPRWARNHFTEILSEWVPYEQIVFPSLEAAETSLLLEHIGATARMHAQKLLEARSPRRAREYQLDPDKTFMPRSEVSARLGRAASLGLSADRVEGREQVSEGERARRRAVLEASTARFQAGLSRTPEAGEPAAGVEVGLHRRNDEESGLKDCLIWTSAGCWLQSSESGRWAWDYLGDIGPKRGVYFFCKAIKLDFAE